MGMTMKRVRNDFITGIAVLSPLAITIVVLNFVLRGVNSALLQPIVNLFELYIKSPYVIVLAKVMVLLLIIAGIILIGAAMRILFLRRIFGFWEDILLKIPMVNKIYKATKELSMAFVGEGKTVFKKVALVEYPRKGVYSIAFVAAESKKDMNDKTGQELMNVFVPSTPNPTTGYLLVVPKKDIILLDMSVEEAVKLVMFGGAV